jgi:tetratricopeptide (TPR) repeat protein
MSEDRKDAFETLLSQADIYLRAGNYRRTLDISKDVIHLSPDEPAGYIVAGRANAGLQRFAEARACFEKALSRLTRP